MSFITEESGICLGHSGEVAYPFCGELVREGELKYILEEGGKVLLTDTPCGGPIPEFDCNFDRKVVDTGKFITLTNVCTLPITVTGFTMSDPARFSLFEYPLHKGTQIYTSGNTADLPFTLQPNEFKRINTYFHPLISELTNGTPGTFDNRVGDSFESRVEIYPGFPIQNCTNDPNSCDAYFTLSGEFVCEEPDKDWMYNNENFITPNLSDLGGIDADYCIPITDPIEMVKDGGLHIENTFSGLRDTAIAYGKVLDDGGRLDEKYQDIGMAGSLAGFGAICQGLIDSNSHNDINNLFGATLTNYSYTYDDGEKQYPLTINYNSNNTAIKSFNDIPHTGMLFDVFSEDPSRETYYSTVFINVGAKDAQRQLNRMFTAQKGEYTLEDFCTPEKFESKNVPANLVYFSDAAIGYEDANGKTDAWKIYHNIFGRGRYADGSSSIDNVPSTIDSILIVRNAKLTYYSEKDLNGEILIEETGPKLIYNSFQGSLASGYEPSAFALTTEGLEEGLVSNGQIIQANFTRIDLTSIDSIDQPIKGSFKIEYLG